MGDGGFVGAEAFWSFRLEADAVTGDAEQLGDILANCCGVRADFGRGEKQS